MGYGIKKSVKRDRYERTFFEISNQMSKYTSFHPPYILLPKFSVNFNIIRPYTLCKLERVKKAKIHNGRKLDKNCSDKNILVSELDIHVMPEW